MIKVIGIDPGLAATGYGIIKGISSKIIDCRFGTIKTPKDMLLANRLEQIFSQLIAILSKYSPDLMVIEDVFSLKVNPQSGITLGKVSGVILLAGCKSNIPTLEISAREAKKALPGNGAASKIQLEEAVRRRLGVKVPIKPSHASDALGLALIGLLRARPS